MKTVKYYNPKNNRYQISEVLEVNNDEVICLNKKYNHKYRESLENLKRLSIAPNPNWHGETKKPLIILNF
jgi:hypothetical protein